MKLRAQLGQHRSQPSRIEEVLHVEIARRLEIHEHGRLIGDGVEPVEGDRHPRASRDGREMNDGVGGAADGEKDAQGVLEGMGGENAIGREPRGTQPHRRFPRRFRRAQPIRVHGRNGGRPRQRHAQRLREAGHGAGRAHHRAGSRGGGEPALDAVDLVLGYLSRAVAPPEATAVRARAQSFTLPSPGHHGSGHELYGGHARGGRPHELGGHCLVAAAH